jgi:non-specific serine/threonine protein kinase
MRAAFFARVHVESMQVSYEMGAYQPVPGFLEVAASVAYTYRQGERAVRLLGAAAGLREAQGGQRPTAYRAQHDQMVGSLRRRLGEEAFETTWTEGRRLPIDQAVADVRMLAAELETQDEQSVGNEHIQGPQAVPAGLPDGLSRREVEVLRLIAAGKSNREIAEALVISVNTVIRHIAHIFAKTGTTNWRNRGRRSRSPTQPWRPLYPKRRLHTVL